MTPSPATYLCLGMMIGGAVIWWHFARCRMLRTRREWYSDPVVREWHPEEAQAAVPATDAEELARVRRLNESLAARVAAQSDLLTRRAEKRN